MLTALFELDTILQNIPLEMHLYATADWS